jgi:choline dehydrogenase-like flavoprotein
MGIRRRGQQLHIPEPSSVFQEEHSIYPPGRFKTISECNGTVQSQRISTFRWAAPGLIPQLCTTLVNVSLLHKSAFFYHLIHQSLILCQRWVQPALNAIGIPTVQDFNSGSLLGAQYSAQTIRPTGETRDSSESSFLAAAFARPNLHVFNNTMAKKINFSGTTATGVTITSILGTSQLKATKEVIVSAGAFQSPQLLMVSGIGPASILKKLKIPVVQTLAGVGQGMQDHIFFGPSYRVKVPTLTTQANVSTSVFFQSLMVRALTCYLL